MGHGPDGRNSERISRSGTAIDALVKTRGAPGPSAPGKAMKALFAGKSMRPQYGAFMVPGCKGLQPSSSTTAIEALIERSKSASGFCKMPT